MAGFYEFRPGVGTIARRGDGLHYRIDRGLDGPPSANDYLTIDTLGRPQPPTAQVSLRFDSTQWRTEVAVEYDFETKTNGRAAYVWIAFGDPISRSERSVAFVRSADLRPDSQRLSLMVRNAPGEPVAKELSDQPKKLNWFRVTRDGPQFRADWSEDGATFLVVSEWTDPMADEHQAIVVNSSSFAGGAAFVVRSIRIAGAMPKEAPPAAPLFAVHGHESAPAEVDSRNIIDALRAGRRTPIRLA